MRPACFSPAKKGDRLQRLAEPHVVGEHAAHAEHAQALQPREPLGLVRAQGGRHHRRALGGLFLAQSRERPTAFANFDSRRSARAARSSRPWFLRGGPARPLRAPETRAASSADRSPSIKLDEHLEKLAQLFGGNARDTGARRRARRETAPACGAATFKLAAPCDASSKIEQRRHEIDAPPFDLDAELEAEPIGLVVGVDVGIPRGLAVDDLVAVAGVDLDAEAEGAKLRHRVSGERAPRVLVTVELHQVIGLGTRQRGVALRGTKARRRRSSRECAAPVLRPRRLRGTLASEPESATKNCPRSSDADTHVPS